MIVVAALVLVALSVPLAGGSLRALAEVRVRAVGAAIAALAIQIGIINIFEHTIAHPIAVVAHLVSYGLAGWFVVANLRIRGLWLVALGAAMNLAPIIANHGVMPSSPTAARLAGHAQTTEKFVNSISTPNAKLAVLGDIFAIPAGYPLANVFSIGDIILVAGAGTVLHTASASRLRRSPRVLRT
jgi:hypothetical protein